MPGGRSRESLHRELAGIEARLASEEHFEYVPTRMYGHADPCDSSASMVFPCVCGRQARVFKDVVATHPGAAKKPYWFVGCDSCGTRSLPGKLPWRAVTAWNRSPDSAKPELKDFPFFMLGMLSPAEAHTWLIAIREDVELRRREAALRSRLGLEVGRAYADRLDAYHAWLLVAFAVLAARD